MQSEVPSLPLVCTNGLSRSPRKDTKGTSTSQSICKNAALILPSGKLRSMFASPYKNSTRTVQVFEPAKSTSKNAVAQRITSAKMLRIKQLQNQLADAHYHLNELANENRLLKVLQKRQDSALRQYEGTNAQLPKIINSHQEELRVLGAKYKKLKAQYRDTCDVLKEKDKELLNLQASNKKLVQLSKDRHLGEREKLQMQVFDLNHRINQQDEMIQTLKRKLTLESKYLKHQLNGEVQRHRDTQRALHETLKKLRDSELLLDNREKRLIYGTQPPVFKERNVKSLSLTNLVDRSSGKAKTGSPNKRKSDTRKNPPVLPVLSSAESSNSEQQHVPSLAKTETMASLQNLRKFRLSKNSYNEDSVAPSEKILKDLPRGEGDRLTSTEIDRRQRLENSDQNEKVRSTYELPNTIKSEYYSSGDEAEESKQFTAKEETRNIQKRSREPYTRVTSSPIERIPSVQVAEEKMQNSLEKLVTNYETSFKKLESESPEPAQVDSLKRDVDSDDGATCEESYTDTEADRITPTSTDTPEATNNFVPSRKSSEESQGESVIPINPPNASSPNGLSTLIKSSISFNNSSNSPNVFVEQKKSLTFKELMATDLDEPTDTWNQRKSQVLKDLIQADRSETNNLLNERIESQELPKSRRNSKSNIEVEETKTNSPIETVQKNSLPFNKEKLLAAMKAIDDNENIEIVEQKQYKNTEANRLRITENLYRGIPTQSRRNSDTLHDLDRKSNNGHSKASCSKLH